MGGKEKGERPKERRPLSPYSPTPSEESEPKVGLRAVKSKESRNLCFPILAPSVLANPLDPSGALSLLPRHPAVGQSKKGLSKTATNKEAQRRYRPLSPPKERKEEERSDEPLSGNGG